MRAGDKRRENAAFDGFRLVSAFWIVAIHTGPFSGINGEADDYLTYCIGRIGVPFFLMMTGYFVLSGTGAPGNARPEEGKRKITQTLKKLGILYLAATVLYLPLTWYAGNLPRTVGEALRWVVFDGTFYHLWYLPGAMRGRLEWRRSLWRTRCCSIWRCAGCQLQRDFSAPGCRKDSVLKT